MKRLGCLWLIFVMLVFSCACAEGAVLYKTCIEDCKYVVTEDLQWIGTEAVEAQYAGDYKYVVNGDDTVAIIEWSGMEQDVVIPSELGGRRVKGISFGAFSNMEGNSTCAEGIISVSIPDSITEIEGNPFWGCTMLWEFKVSPDHPSFATIDGVLFEKTSKKLVAYPNGRYDVREYEVPNGILEIGAAAFYENHSLSRIILPDTLDQIGIGAFSECCELSEIRIPDSVTQIGVDCFSVCEKLSDMKLPNGLQRISAGMFAGCSSLESIELPQSVNAIGDMAFASCTSLDEIYIPDGVAEIGTEAFEFCKLAQELVLPESLISIGEGPFNCTEITKVRMGANVSLIQGNPFPNCSYLVQIEVSPENDSFASLDGALYCKQDKRLIAYPCGRNDENVIVPEGIQTIGEFAFSSGKFGHVSLPKSLATIEENAFQACNNLQMIEIPASVVEIGERAFSGCTSMKRVALSDSVERIGAWAFSWCEGLENVQIPASVASIDDGAFQCCSALSHVELPNGLLEIGESAFYETALTELTIPESVQTLDPWIAPDGCTLVVGRDTPAREYAEEYGYEYTYPDADAWLYQ